MFGEEALYNDFYTFKPGIFMTHNGSSSLTALGMASSRCRTQLALNKVDFDSPSEGGRKHGGPRGAQEEVTGWDLLWDLGSWVWDLG